MATIDKTHVSYGAKDQDPLAMVFRKTIDASVTPMAAGTDFALFKLPKGFSPCRAFVDVQTIDGVITFDVDIMDVDGNSKGLLIDNQSLAATGYFLAGDDEITKLAIIDDDAYLCIDVSAEITTAKFEVVLIGWCLKTPAEMSLTLTDEDAQ
jgi:hypothetical protein